MTTTDDKAMLHGYLQGARDALLWKVEGLSERELRLPRTTTGTNLLGLVKHAASIEIGYFGTTFGRPWPTPEEVPWLAAWTDDSLPDDPQADFYATADETAAQIVDLYRRVWSFADETIDALPLDAPGLVPWWGDHGATTLHRIVVHVTVDLARHAGHADILRENLDGTVGMRAANTNMPDEVDFAEYAAMLTGIADRFDDHPTAP